MTEQDDLKKDLELIEHLFKVEDETIVSAGTVSRLLSSTEKHLDKGAALLRELAKKGQETATKGMEYVKGDTFTPKRPSIVSEQPDGVSDRELLGIMAFAMLDRTRRVNLLSNPVNETIALNFARYVLHEEGETDKVTYLDMLKGRFPNLSSKLRHMKDDLDDDWDIGLPPVAEVDTMTLIVHGTFAREASWWRPQTGAFWQYIDGITHDAYAQNDVFRWSGGLLHSHRVVAAQQLKTWVQKHPAKQLRVIAHSHGANVCYLASRLGVKFDQVIALGAPICLQYIPLAQKFGHIDNVFSTNDMVQLGGSKTTFGVDRRGEGRTLTEQSNVANTWAEYVSLTQTHTSLHDPAIWRKNNLQALL